LGGARFGKYKTIRNTFIIFLVSGFWHGASWNFIAWGFIHACGFLPLLLLNRNRRHITDVVAKDRKLPNLKELWQMLTTFTFVTIAWIFFRADGLRIALSYLRQIGASIIEHPGQFLSLPDGKMAFVYIIPLVLGDWYLRRNERVLKLNLNHKKRMAVYMIILLFIFTKFGANQHFIYFQF
jgi:hypothetical protein